MITTAEEFKIAEEFQIKSYLADVDFFMDIFQEHVDFDIRATLKRRAVERIQGEPDNDREKEAVALYNIACRMAKDWEAFWMKRGKEEVTQ